MLTDEQREKRNAYARAYYAKQRKLRLEARALVKSMNEADSLGRRPGRPALTPEERVERRRARDRARYAKKVGHAVEPRPKLSDEERRAKWRERYRRRKARLGVEVKPRPKLTPEERLERRRARQREYQRRKAEAARAWKALKAQAAIVGWTCDGGERPAQFLQPQPRKET